MAAQTAKPRSQRRFQALFFAFSRQPVRRFPSPPAPVSAFFAAESIAAKPRKREMEPFWGLEIALNNGMKRAACGFARAFGFW